MTSIERASQGAPVERRWPPGARLSLEDAGVWLVVPCYKVKGHILRVIEKTPAWMEGIVCVDDACPEGSADFIEANNRDPRVVVVRLPANQGVGGATLAGYAEAARRGGRVFVKVDGDDQMDLTYAAQLVAPILMGDADYAKGNRFSSVSHLATMPTVRVLGNAALSFAAKLSTGYWNIFDPTNGYTAIEAGVARLVMEKRVSRRFFFETDLLYHLGTLRAVVRDVPMPARYADEVSNIRIGQIVGPFALKHMRNFFQRVVGQYFVRDFNAASLELVFGLFSLLFGLGYAASYIVNRTPGQAASAGVVMMAALPVILGAQFLLQAMNFDVLNVPSRPIHPYLNTVRRLEDEESPAVSPKDMVLCALFAVAMPAGQMLFKWGAVYDKGLSGPFLLRILVNYPLLAAFAWYGLTALLWFFILTRVPLSTAYAFALVGMVVVPLLGWLVFKEPFAWTMAVGYGLMIVGLGLVMVRPGA